jgi:plasmid stabilization system protein ParE
MKYRIVLSPDAKADMRSARRWYTHINPSLAQQFRVECRTTARRIAQFPYQFSLVNGTARKALLKRFPYVMYYRLYSKLVIVDAVLHQRRSDAIWKQRTRR